MHTIKEDDVHADEHDSDDNDDGGVDDSVDDDDLAGEVLSQHIIQTIEQIKHTNTYNLSS